jgi:peptidoglycan/LPS O-acetylase OafA/YrhL
MKDIKPIRSKAAKDVLMLTRSKVVGYFLELAAVVFFMAAAAYYGDYSHDQMLGALLTACVGFVLLVLGVREARADHSRGKAKNSW